MIFNMNGVNFDTQIKRDEIPNLHVWKYEDADGNSQYLTGETRDAYTDGMQDYVAPRYELGTQTTNAVISYFNGQGAYGVRWYYCDEITVTSDGTIQFNSSNTRQLLAGVSSTSAYKASYDELKGKYIKHYKNDSTATHSLDETKVYYIPTDAVFTDSISYEETRLDKCYEVVGYPESSSGTYTYISQLAEGGRTVKKELISEIVASNITTTLTFFNIPVDTLNVDGILGFMFEFEGDIYFKNASSSQYNLFFSVTSNSSNSSVGNYSDTYKKFFHVGKSSDEITINNTKINIVAFGSTATYSPSYNGKQQRGYCFIGQTTSAFSIPHYKYLQIVIFYDNSSVSFNVNGVFRVYALKS